MDPADQIVYVRLSLVRPKPGNEGAVAAIENDLMAFFTKQPGYVHGYQIVAGAAQTAVGRLTIWRSPQDADHAAQQQHVLAQRSELNMLIEPDSHEEDSWAARAFEPP
jgi:hypothetical protein